MDVTMPGTHGPDAVTPTLALCGHAPGTSPRRGLCQRCYRKLLEAGLPLPPRLAPGPAPLDGLASWARSLPDDVRRRMLAALMEVM